MLDRHQSGPGAQDSHGLRSWVPQRGAMPPTSPATLGCPTLKESLPPNLWIKAYSPGLSGQCHQLSPCLPPPEAAMANDESEPRNQFQPQLARLGGPAMGCSEHSHLPSRERRTRCPESHRAVNQGELVGRCSSRLRATSNPVHLPQPRALLLRPVLPSSTLCRRPSTITEVQGLRPPSPRPGTSTPSPVALSSISCTLWPVPQGLAITVALQQK